MRIDGNCVLIEGRRATAEFGWAHAETQPRLTLRQSGKSGTLSVAVRLRLKT